MKTAKTPRAAPYPQMCKTGRRAKKLRVVLSAMAVVATMVVMMMMTIDDGGTGSFCEPCGAAAPDWRMRMMKKTQADSQR